MRSRRRQPPGPAELRRRAAARLRLFAVLLLALVVCQMLTLPWRLAGLGFGLAAMSTGIRLLVDLIGLRRAGLSPGGWIGVSIGLGLAAVLTLTLAGEAAFYPLVHAQEECLTDALTHLAQQQCQQDLDRRIAQLDRQLSGTG